MTLRATALRHLPCFSVVHSTDRQKRPAPAKCDSHHMLADLVVRALVRSPFDAQMTPLAWQEWEANSRQCAQDLRVVMGRGRDCAEHNAMILIERGSRNLL